MTVRQPPGQQRHGRRLGRLLGVAAAAVLAVGMTTPHAALAADGGGRHLDVTAHDDGGSGPPHDYFTLNTQTLKAGLVEVDLRNAGSVPHQAQLLRLHDGITLEHFQHDVAASHGGAVLQLSDAAGGSNAVDPGGRQVSFINLRAGSYIVLCFLSDGGDGVPHFAHGMLTPFTVQGHGDSAHPPGRVAGGVEAFSFGFHMPATVDGHALYRFTNSARSDTHEMTILRLAPGRTADDVLAWTQHGESGPPPVTASGGGAGALPPGGTSWVRLDLPPGDYVTVCFVPDDEGDHPTHASLGMVQGFTAT